MSLVNIIITRKYKGLKKGKEFAIDRVIAFGLIKRKLAELIEPPEPEVTEPIETAEPTETSEGS